MELKGETAIVTGGNSGIGLAISTALAQDGLALCRMFNQAISGQGLPTRWSLDHDPLGNGESHG
jgi:NAD(P)-dependent dehydrogenase (short-subunit alcohol dehydrogenase family)